MTSTAMHCELKKTFVSVLSVVRQISPQAVIASDLLVRVGWVLNVLRGGGLVVNLVGDLCPIVDSTMYVFILNQ